MIQKPLNKIEQSDIDTLLSEKVAESRTLDYKLKLHGGSDSEKKEFLADVCAFANSSGGDLIYGVEEERDTNGKPTGIPKTIDGVDIQNFDSIRLAIESSIRNGISPRIPSFEFRAIGSYSLGPVLILRVQQSWAQPHWVTFQKEAPFYARGGGGKYPMDIGQIRAAFNLSLQLEERVSQFRERRMNLIRGHGAPIPMDLNKPKAILHIIPALFGSNEIERDTIVKPESFRSVPPPVLSSWDHLINFDGFVNFGGRSNNSNTAEGYVQYFRNGVIEFVSEKIVTQRQDTSGPQTSLIPSLAFEIYLIKSLKAGVEFLKQIQVPTPYFIGLTLFGVKERVMSVDNWRIGFFDPRPIDRDILAVPDFRFDEEITSYEKFMHPIFDYIWRASGIPGSPYYDKSSGERIDQ